MWQSYLKQLDDSDRTICNYESWHFSDNKKDADFLVKLVLEGTKRATASIVRAYEIENEAIPKKGALSILSDFEGNAKCIIKTIKIMHTY